MYDFQLDQWDDEKDDQMETTRLEDAQKTESFPWWQSSWSNCVFGVTSPTGGNCCTAASERSIENPTD